MTAPTRGRALSGRRTREWIVIGVLQQELAEDRRQPRTGSDTTPNGTSKRRGRLPSDPGFRGSRFRTGSTKRRRRNARERARFLDLPAHEVAWPEV